MYIIMTCGVQVEVLSTCCNVCEIRLFVRKPVLKFSMYSETCSCDHLYSETTSIQKPLGHVPIVALPCIFSSIKRPHLFKDHFILAQAWSLNTGFTVLQYTVDVKVCLVN